MDRLNYGRNDGVYHRIHTGDARPIRQLARRLPLAKMAGVGKMLENMELCGVMEESERP
jgi:hypothetical protein